MPDTQAITLQLLTHILEQTHQLIQQEKIKTIDEFVIIALQKALIDLQPLDNQSPAIWTEKNPQLATDPLGELGKSPVVSGITDASANLDRYLYQAL